MISLVISGRAKAGNIFCNKIARAFHIPSEIIFRKAGLLPPPLEKDDSIREIEQIYKHLDRDSQAELVEYARLRLKIQEKRGEYKSKPKES